MKRIALLLLLSTMACRSPKLDDAERANVVASRHARIESLSRTCDTEARAMLVEVAGGTFHWKDALADHEQEAADEDIRQVRCHAMSAAKRLFPMPPSRNFAAIRKRAAPFTRKDVKQALDAMLADHVAWCSETTLIGTTRMIAPRAAAQTLLIGLTVEPLRDVIERGDPRLLSEVERDRGYAPGPRVEAVDAAIWDLSPDGFVRMLELIDPAHTWRDGRPPPTAEERLEIENHGIDALHWLDQLSGEELLDCEFRLQESIASGELGAALVAHLAHPNPRVRTHILHTLANVIRPGLRNVLEQVAAHDPDEDVRSAAERAIWAYDRGGMIRAHQQQVSGSATP